MKKRRKKYGKFPPSPYTNPNHSSSASRYVKVAQSNYKDDVLKHKIVISFDETNCSKTIYGKNQVATSSALMVSSQRSNGTLSYRYDGEMVRSVVLQSEGFVCASS